MSDLMRALKVFITLTFLFPFFLHAGMIEEPDFCVPGLARDLMIVDCVNRELCDHLPVFYNHTLQGGYFQMPSCRMGEVGELAFGYSAVSPYRNWNFRAQILPKVELTGNYRIFDGILDPVFGHLGFGEFSDKGANLKIAVILPKDSDYLLPGLAWGWDDFLGSKGFESQYLVATKVWHQYNLEASIGYGWYRINGVFGGLMWMPWRKCENLLFSDLSFNLEYDAVKYSRDPHPDGKRQDSDWNFGIKHRFYDLVDLSVSYVRGVKFAYSASVSYNLGETDGFVPKIHDPLPYMAPRNREPIGCFRSENVLVQDLIHPFQCQGFCLLGAWLTSDECCSRILGLRVYNSKWTFEHEVRIRLNHLLANLVPENIDKVIVVMESEGFPIQEYHYQTPFLNSYGCCGMGDFTLDLLTPMTEVSRPDPCCTRTLYYRSRPFFCCDLLPKVKTHFGSTKGKFKYALGVNFGGHGFLYDDVYYEVLFGYIGITKLGSVTGIDALNPSQLINVKTDVITYYKARGVTIDKIYLQKTVNFGCGLYGRLALGHFSQQYGGVGAELLFYPVNSNWAIGGEWSLVRKRKIHGIHFTPRIRKLEGYDPTYVRFTGKQYFVDVYYDNPCLQLDFQFSYGKFLANDRGFRTEAGRYFNNGLRLFFWYTRTDGHDVVNGETYYDKGVGISMPLDVFYTCSTRKMWNWEMSAWLRDVGYRTFTGPALYDTIHEQRIR